MKAATIDRDSHVKVRPGSDGIRPWFVAPGEANYRGRLLLLSYHFPPSQGTGALRWQKMSRDAAERGWGMDVVTLDPAELSEPDPSRLEDLPPGTRIYGVPEPELRMERLEHLAWRLYRALRPKRRKSGAPSDRSGGADPVSVSAGHHPASVAPEEIRWTLGNPRQIRRAYYAWLRTARDRSWAVKAAQLAQRLVADNPGRHQVVIATGPPHMTYEGGRRVSARAGLPLVIDLRDPWSIRRRIHEEYASPVYFHLADRYERRAVEQASLVVANTDALRAAMQHVYPRAHGRIITVTNGYDEDPLPSTPQRDRFIIAYAGVMYLQRDPRLLFRAAARVIQEFGIRPDQFGFEFIGGTTAGNGVPIETIARSEGLEGFVRAQPRRPRQEALELLSQASLLFSYPHNPLAIPSKIYEYMRFPAWVLTLAEPGTPAATVLQDTGADVLAPDDLEGITRVLRNRYLQFAAGERPGYLAGVEQFSRRNQARILFDAIEARVSTPR